MKLLRTTALTAALMTAAVMSVTSPAQAQLAWWGWPGLVAAGTGTGNPYANAYGYPASRYATSPYQSYSSYGGYGIWNNPWYRSPTFYAYAPGYGYQRPYRYGPMPYRWRY